MKSIFKALSDKNKRKIVSMLQKKDMCVSDMLVNLPIKQATLSAHLAYLRAVGLVEVEKENRFRIYKLNRPTLDEFVNKINLMFSNNSIKRNGEIGNIIDTGIVLRR